MQNDLPTHFFRIRENGAAVFRVDDANRSRRLEFEQIAVVNVRNGEVKPHGGRVLDDDDLAAISVWMEERVANLAKRDIDNAQSCIEQLNLTAQWAQSKASDDDLARVTDELILAMHDLRSVLVRKKADRLSKTLPGSSED